MRFTVGRYTIFNAFATACIYMYVHTYIHTYRHTLFDIMAYGPFIIDGTLGSFVGCCNSQSAPIATDCIQQPFQKFTTTVSQDTGVLASLDRMVSVHAKHLWFPIRLAMELVVLPQTVVGIRTKY